jgi:FkbM family methyltransferase
MSNRDTYGWEWTRFAGSAEALKWNRRDLPVLEAVIGLVPATQRRFCVQAGGNLGIFPKFLSRYFGAVLTFEPAPALFPLLVQNCPEPNVIRWQAALGECHEGVGLSQRRRDGRTNHHEGITHIAGPGIVPTVRLDDFELPICDLLYLDLEGWELHAMRGAGETIRRCRPVIACEVNKNAAFVGFTKEEIRACILSLGYRFVERHHSDDVYVPQEWAA